MEVNARVKPGSRYFRTLSVVQRILPEPMWLQKIALKRKGDAAKGTEEAYLEIHGVVEESNLTLGEVEDEFEAALSADPVISKVVYTFRDDQRVSGRSKFIMEVHYK